MASRGCLSGIGFEILVSLKDWFRSPYSIAVRGYCHWGQDMIVFSGSHRIEKGHALCNAILIPKKHYLGWEVNIKRIL